MIRYAVMVDISEARKSALVQYAYLDITAYCSTVAAAQWAPDSLPPHWIQLPTYLDKYAPELHLRVHLWMQRHIIPTTTAINMC